MPHVIAEYSANLDALLDMQGFCDHLLKAACQIDAYPKSGIRVRALKAEHYAIADGDAKHGYIDISVRMRAGRSDAVKDQVAMHLFNAAQDFTQSHAEKHSFALSLELRDIDPKLAPKTSTIADHMKGGS